MSELSRFYGIVVFMYNKPREHNPPHFHARYQGVEYAFYIKTGTPVAGTTDPPRNMKRMIKEWWNINKTALAIAWASQRFPKIPPLD